MSSPTIPIPATEFSPLVPFLGQFISGDVAGYTVYTTRRGKIVWYPASPADKPPSALQTKQRLRFKVAQAYWQKQSSVQKATWELLTKRLSLPLTGQNLFISLCFSQNQAELTTALNRAHLTLSLPPPVPN